MKKVVCNKQPFYYCTVKHIIKKGTMNLFNVFKAFISLLVLVVIFSCEKEYKAGGSVNATIISDNNDNELIIEESGILYSIFNDELENDIQTFNITAENTQVIYTDKGIRIGIYNKPFVDKDGNEVTGNITLEILEVFDKADMFRYNKTTNAVNGSGESGLLISGGQLYVQGYQNGEEISIKDNSSLSLEIPISNEEENPYQMSLWDGNVDSDGNITWVGSTGFGEVYSDSIGDPILYGNLPNFGWINCDYWYSDPREKTDVTVDFSMLTSSEFSKINIEAYFSIAANGSQIGSFRSKEGPRYSFGRDYIPIGQELHIIIIGVGDNDKLYYYIETITVVKDHEIKVTTMQESNLDAIAALISNLN